MFQQKSPTFLLLSIVLWTILALSLAQNTFDIYVDSNSPGTETPDGTLDNPFKNFEDAVTVLRSQFPKTKTSALLIDSSQITINLEKTGNYTLLKSLVLIGQAGSSFSIKSYSNNIESPLIVPQDFSDCELLPSLTLNSSGIETTNITNIKISGIKFKGIWKNQDRYWKSISPQDFNLESSCFVGSPPERSTYIEKFFEISHASNFSKGILRISNVLTDLNQGSGFLDFENTRRELTSSEVYFENLTINGYEVSTSLKSFAELRISSNSVNGVYENFPRDSNKLLPQIFLGRNITLNMKGQKGLANMNFYGWSDIHFQGYYVQNQNMKTFVTRMLEIKDSYNVSLTEIHIDNNNFVDFKRDLYKDKGLISLENVNMISLENNTFMRNSVQGSSAMTLFELKNIYGALKITNVAMNFNKFSLEFSGFRFTPGDDKNTKSVLIENIMLNNNMIDETKSFFFFKSPQASFEEFNARNISMTNNQLTGRLFDIEVFSELDRRSPTNIFNLTGFYVVDNILSGFALASLSVRYPAVYYSKTYFGVEPYGLGIRNLKLTNNIVKQVAVSGEKEQFSLLQIYNSQLYLGDSILSNNTFVKYSFILSKEGSPSIFFANNTCESTRIQEGHLIISSSEAVDVKLANSTWAKDLNIWYRSTVVIDSRFRNMSMKNGSIFTLNIGYVLFVDNIIESLEMKDSYFLDGGKWTSPGGNDTFVRDLKKEKLIFGAVDSRILEAFQSALDELQKTGEIVYFYLIKNNLISGVSGLDKNFIKVQDYKAHQSIIAIQQNTLKGFSTTKAQSQIINLIGSINIFSFENNALSEMRNMGGLVSIALLQDNKEFLLRNNTLTYFQGQSFLLAQGGSISNMKISQNKITQSNFSKVLISIDMSEHHGQMVLSENILINNILRATQDDPNFKLSFLSIVIGEASKGSQPVILDDWNFVNNRFENTRSMLQFKQLNAFFSFLLGNSSLIMRNSVFEETSLQSSGSSMFYIGSLSAAIENCTFKSNQVASGDALFDFIVPKVSLIDNQFHDIQIPHGYSLIYLNSYPYLQTPIQLDIHRNTFSLCSTGSGDNLKGRSNVLAVETGDLSVKAVENVFIDSFDYNPLISFKNTTCLDCFFENSKFLFTEIEKSDHVVFSCDSLSGELKIIASKIQQEYSLKRRTTFLQNSKSPNSSFIIDNISWNEEGVGKTSFRIVNTDSGNFTLMNTQINNVEYPSRSNQIFSLIQANPTNQLSGRIALKNVRITNITLEKNNDDSISTGVISIYGITTENNSLQDWWALSVEDCTFKNISNGSAIFVQSLQVNNINIAESLFEGITNCSSGSALNYAMTNPDSPAKISIKDSKFIKNQALKSGGAISLAHCDHFISRNEFSENIAGSSGAAIVLKSSANNDFIMANNLFESNQAKVENEISSVLSNIKLEFLSPKESYMSIYSSNHTSVDFIVQNASTRWISTSSLKITFADTDNLPAIDFSPNEDIKSRFSVKFGNQATISSINCTINGCFLDRFNTTISGNAGDTIDVRVTYYSKNIGIVTRTFQMILRSCIPGEYHNKQTKTCDYCQPGSYSLVPTEACEECPKTAECLGGNVMRPALGFWWTKSNTTTVLKCRKDGVDRCGSTKNVNANVSEQGCVTGYAGPKCEACDFDEGYIQAGLLKCKKCKDRWMSVWYGLGSMVLLLLYKMYCIGKIYEANENFCAEKPDEALTIKTCESSYYAQLQLVYTQILSLIFLLNNEVREFSGSLLQIGNPSEFVLNNLQCALSAFNFQPENFIYVSNLILIAGPFVKFVLIIFSALIFRRKIFPKMVLSRFVRLCIVYLLLVEQPGIVGNFAAFLSCSKPYPGSLVEYITLHPNWTCQDSDYSKFKYLVAIPTIVIWAVIIPLYIYYSLVRNQYRLEDKKVRVAWGALYNTSKMEYYYWGMVVMGLKLAISFTTYLFSHNISVCIATIFVLLWGYYFLIHQLKPYKFEMFNMMESLTCILLMLNLILGYYIIDNEYVVLKYMAYGVLGVCNGAMAVFLGWKIFMLKGMKYIKKIVDAYKKCFGKKEVKEEELNKRLLMNEESFAQTENNDMSLVTNSNESRKGAQEKDQYIL